MHPALHKVSKHAMQPSKYQSTYSLPVDGIGRDAASALCSACRVVVDVHAGAWPAVRESVVRCEIPGLQEMREAAGTDQCPVVDEAHADE